MHDKFLKQNQHSLETLVRKSLENFLSSEIMHTSEFPGEESAETERILLFIITVCAPLFSLLYTRMEKSAQCMQIPA
jgi:hypothetical protein